MTLNQALPPARKRQPRDGLTALAWSTAPDAAEAWPDKVRIKIRGHVAWDGDRSFFDYLQAIAPSSYVTAQPSAGRQFRANVRYGPSITGELRINMATGSRADEPHAGEARITLTLNLNPTTARAMAVRRHEGPLDTATMRQFFKPLQTTQEAFGEGIFADPTEKALDGSDNVLLSVAELGGLTVEDRATTRAEFLETYEAKLRALAQEMVDPRTRPLAAEDPHCGSYRVTLDWGSLVLQQAELYFERRSDDPVAVVRRLHDRALDLARRIKAQAFADVPFDGRPVPTTFAIVQDDGYPHLVVPLTGTRNIELSIYAKTNRRVRFEVRYRKGFGNHLKGCSTSDDRLSSLLSRLMGNAARRLPWRSLARAAALPPAVNIGEIPELLLHLVTATARNPSLFEPIVRQLVIVGGVFDDDERHPGISAAIRRLERAGVVFRWPVQQKEERQNRRFGLSERFAEVRKSMLTGFWPTPPGDLMQMEPEYPDDHYEVNARVAGGRQWVERPLRR